VHRPPSSPEEIVLDSRSPKHRRGACGLAIPVPTLLRRSRPGARRSREPSRVCGPCWARRRGRLRLGGSVRGTAITDRGAGGRPIDSLVDAPGAGRVSVELLGDGGRRSAPPGRARASVRCPGASVARAPEGSTRFGAVDGTDPHLLRDAPTRDRAPVVATAGSVAGPRASDRRGPDSRRGSRPASGSPPDATALESSERPSGGPAAALAKSRGNRGRCRSDEPTLARFGRGRTRFVHPFLRGQRSHLSEVEVVAP
jgi:hypothetical protein